MPFPRSPIVRLAAAVGISLLLCALGYVGLGWAVRAQPRWIIPLLGDHRYFRLYDSYARVAAALSPADRDGDGVRDGAEFFDQSDLHNPKHHRALVTDREANGIFARQWGVLQNSNLFETRPAGRTALVGEAGEHLHVCYSINGLHPWAIPRGFRVQLTPPTWLLIGPPGGTLSSTTLILPVAENGLFAFDAQIQPPPGEPEGPLHGELTLQNAATGQPLDNFRVDRVWKLQTSLLTIEPVSHDRWREDPDDRLEGDKTLSILRWPPPPSGSPAVEFLIEAARDQADAPWHPIAFPDFAAGSSCVIKRLVSGPLKPYAGPLKYRVVTFRNEPSRGTWTPE